MEEGGCPATFRLQIRTLLRGRFVNERSFIGNDCPVGFSLALESPCSLEVGLVETREDVVAKICLELSVQVLLTIDLVREGMKADTVFPVLVQEVDLDSVNLLVSNAQHRSRDRHMMVLEDVRVLSHRLPVYGVFCNFDTTEIKEEICGWGLIYVELDFNTACKPFTTRHVNLNVVGDVGEALGSHNAVCRLHKHVLFVS